MKTEYAKMAYDFLPSSSSNSSSSSSSLSLSLSLPLSACLSLCVFRGSVLALFAWTTYQLLQQWLHIVIKWLSGGILCHQWMLFLWDLRASFLLILLIYTHFGFLLYINIFEVSSARFASVWCGVLLHSYHYFRLILVFYSLLFHIWGMGLPRNSYGIIVHFVSWYTCFVSLVVFVFHNSAVETQQLEAWWCSYHKGISL